MLSRTKRINLPAIICLTLAICLKPTLGLLLIPYLLWTRAWRTLVATVTISATITAASLYPLLSLGSVWLSSLRENIAVVFTNGGAADVSEQSLLRFDRIDLQLPLYALLHSRTAASLLAALIAATLLLLCLQSKPNNSNQPPSGETLDQHILQIATLLLIGLLPFYQRYYSAMIVLLPILWALRTLSQPASRATQRWVLILSSVFLINTEAIFTRSLLPHLTVRFPLLTNLILGPHLCWLTSASRNPSAHRFTPQAIPGKKAESQPDNRSHIRNLEEIFSNFLSKIPCQVPYPYNSISINDISIA